MGHISTPSNPTKLVINPPDFTNTPSYVVINGVQLPEDTLITIDGKKLLVNSKILDGVNVTERILREPYKIDFECVFRKSNQPGQIKFDKTFWIFDQDSLNNAWKNIWLPDSVLEVQNTYLNALFCNGKGLSEIIVESVVPTTYRGNTNIGFKITAIENVAGQTLIVS